MIEQTRRGINGVVRHILTRVDGAVFATVYCVCRSGRGVENYDPLSFALLEIQLVRGAVAEDQIGGVFLASPRADVNDLCKCAAPCHQSADEPSVQVAVSFECVTVA